MSVSIEMVSQSPGVPSLALQSLFSTSCAEHLKSLKHVTIQSVYCRPVFYILVFISETVQV